ncbi:MAG: hypothetical protein QW069_09080 [Candidatus Caldarchaeum sp.]
MNFEKTSLGEGEAVCDVCGSVGPRKRFITIYGRNNMPLDLCTVCAKKVK